MTVWIWIGAGVAGLLALSLFIAVAIAKILGMIGEEIAELQEAEPWRSAALTRETKALAAGPQIGFGAYARDRRSRPSHG